MEKKYDGFLCPECGQPTVDDTCYKCRKCYRCETCAHFEYKDVIGSACSECEWWDKWARRSDSMTSEERERYFNEEANAQGKLADESYTGPRCPECGYPTFKDKQCYNCGKEVAVNEEKSPKREDPTLPILCGCGEYLYPGDEACQNCKAPVSEEAKQHLKKTCQNCVNRQYAGVAGIDLWENICGEDPNHVFSHEHPCQDCLDIAKEDKVDPPAWILRGDYLEWLARGMKELKASDNQKPEDICPLDDDTDEVPF